MVRQEALLQESCTTINVLVTKEESQKHFWVISHNSTVTGSCYCLNSSTCFRIWEEEAWEISQRLSRIRGLWLLLINDHLSKNTGKLQKRKKYFILSLSAVLPAWGQGGHYKWMQGTLPAWTQADSKWDGWQSGRRGGCLENSFFFFFLVCFLCN